MFSKRLPSKIAQIHDHAFRNAMSDLRVARDFLSHHLPSNVKEKIDLKSLDLQKESYVDKELKLFITGLLYSVALKGKNQQLAYIYLLLEHLSTQKRLTPWRMLEYTCQVVKEKLGESKTKTLPPVIPIVVYVLVSMSTL
jgi:predicted transposase/invertase (TIGR01784 family)